jgi:hypothetical protein
MSESASYYTGNALWRIKKMSRCVKRTASFSKSILMYVEPNSVFTC